ncbi:hypothetical protein H0A61_01862 [Koleobacter methoxysyntrophicus]|jgi:hypothetical protein|uniref:Uncharacterized protein n=1 Tax=Koleobacter methoxysyntrophicus TaxID=2751313 RepID=A0A8A0RM65_9FIRM|nr:hypothetical protein H0A61_01862 [Koleobacter methoxysyntrophicus]
MIKLFQIFVYCILKKDFFYVIIFTREMRSEISEEI